MPKTKRQKLTKELLIKKYYTENMSLTEVAQDTGYCREHVYRTMKKFGIKRRTISESNRGSGNGQYKDGPWRDPEVLKDLIQKNMSTREIAEELGISHTTLARSLRKLGLVSKRKENPSRPIGIDHHMTSEETIKARICPKCKGKKSSSAITCMGCIDRTGQNKGFKHTAESRRKLSEAMRKRAKQPDYVNPMENPESVRKIRVTRLKNIKKRSGQVMPNYNPGSIPLIEKYARENGLDFQHAENGGEYHIKELGYFLDAYDKERNIVLEVDEKHHYDVSRNLKDKDVTRQNEIIRYLGCQFIRIDYETGEINVF